MEKPLRHPVSYRASISIEPNWGEIIKCYFPNLKTDKAVDEFLEMFYKKFKVDEKDSLFAHVFHFLKFYDGASGMNTIWSVTDKHFPPELEVKGYMFSIGSGLLKNMEINKALKDELDKRGEESKKMSNYISISPEKIWTHRDYEGTEVISQMPFYDIVNFFVRVEEETGLAGYIVKKFPNVFELIFERDKVIYESSLGMDTVGDTRTIDNDWLSSIDAQIYKQTVESHIFKTPYYLVSLSMEFFRPDDFGSLGEIPDSSWDVR